MTLVLDAGNLIAYKGDRTVRALLERASRTGVDVRATTGAVAQVWRNGARQARLALLLQALLEVELSAKGSIVDAATDEILTTDPDDTALAARSGKNLIGTQI